ncbi:membrane metallo-endopeptidase-like 1 isoform X2 [Prorops nasuta]|uniref:membrane metallo-endopeptidase-like 1 isoform X2 n=1 Tax=Prorops nasuta TaxID=863751 RepID=UPI0034CDD415
MNRLLNLFIFTLLVMVAKSSDHEVRCAGRSSNFEVCDSESSNQMIASMNTSIHPCNDFYTFMCGSWKEKEIRTDITSLLEFYDEIIKNVNVQITDILQGARAIATAAMGKAKNLYRDCMDLATINRDSANSMLNEINKIGGWPILQMGTFQESDVTERLKNLQYDSLFTLDIVQNYKKPDTRIIMLVQPTPSLPSDINFEGRENNEIIQNYKKYILDVVLHLSRNRLRDLSQFLLQKDINEMVDFELQLSKIWVQETEREKKENYGFLKIQEFQELYDLRGGNHEKAKINWLESMQYLFNEIGVEITSFEKIETLTLGFFLKLPAVLQITNPRAVANYMVWCFVRSLIIYSDQKLITAKYEYHDSIDVYTDPGKNRESTCFNNLNLQKAISFEYVKRYFPGNIKEKATKFAKHLISITKEAISKSSWMDALTTQKSVEKVEAIKTLIGYPDHYTSTYIDDYYQNFTLGSSYLESIINLQKFQRHKEFSKLRQVFNRDEWNVEPTAWNGFYDVVTNALTMTAGFLQRKVYDIDRPDVLNYAVYGSILGHEISHAFDVDGHKFDKNGQFDDYWSPRMRLVYKHRTDCFVDQFNKMPIPELETEDSVPCVNGQKTLSENIADSTGGQLGYNAHKENKKENGGKDIRLIKLEGYNSDKLYFMLLAFSFCGHRIPKHEVSTQLEDCHATSEARVWGTIQNNVDFGEVFGCPPGAPMNPISKCTIL